MRKIYLVLITFLLGWMGVNAQTTTTFSYTGSTQNFTVPAGVTSISVYVYGGGGGSGGAIGNAADQAAGGGGGGACAIKTIAVSAGDIYTITVGNGGTAGSTAGTAGGLGGTTTWTGNAGTITAAGGTGGGGAASAGAAGTAGVGATTGSGYTTIFAGGNGTAGLRTASNEVGGAGGGGAGNNGAGGNGTSTTAAANTVGGAGGAGTPSNAIPYKGGAGASGLTTTLNNAGVAGNAPGGGAAGAATYTTAKAGAIGGAGQVVIIYTPPVPTCATASSPANNATGICSIPPAFTWTAGTGATGYKFYLGTDGGGTVTPTTVLNGTVLGNVLTYTPSVSLASNTVYYWQVVATNSSGSATACSIQKFTTNTFSTGAASPPYSQNFECNNDLVVVNGATNQWVVGTATKNGGTHGIYISNDAGATNNYTNTVASTSHIYKDFTFPMGTTGTVSFDWKGTGEVGYDRLLIYIAPTGVTPVAGTPASNSTVLTGATLKLTQTGTQSTYATATFNLSSAEIGNAAGSATVRIIFTWQNDNNGGVSPGAAIDNISVAAITPPANDDCSGATTITPVTSCGAGTSGTNVAASASSTAASTTCDAGIGTVADVWYKFTADGTSLYTISATNTAAGGQIADLVLVLYSGGCGSLVEQSCSDGPAIGTETITAGVLPAGTYYYRVYGYDGATGAFTTCVSYIANILWTGGTSSNWATGSNWAGGVAPTSGDNATIGTGTFQPVISAPAACINITLNSGTTLAINSTMAVSGNWTNNGCTVSGSGTVTLSNAACTIGGNTTTTFPNLTSTGTVVTMGISTNVSGNFSLPSGQFNVSTSASNNTLAITGNLSVTGGGLNISAGANNSVVTVGGTTTVSSGYITPINSSSATGGTITVTGAVTVSGSGQISLENVSAASGAGIFNANSDVTFTSTAAPIFDFGVGSSLTGNAFNVKGNFSKSGTGAFQTAGTGTPTGVVFNKAGTQTFSYSGANSAYTSYTVASGSTLQMLTGLTMGASSLLPASVFTVSNGGILDAQAFVIAGSSTSSEQFILASGGTLITANGNGVVSGTTGTVSTTVGTRTFNAAANYEFNKAGAQTTNFVTTTMNNLTISGSGTKTQNSAAIIVSNDLTIGAGPTFAMAALSVTLGGNFSNAGTYTSSGAGSITFNKAGNQTVSGGGTTTFQLITLNKGSLTNKVICSSSVAASSVNAITYTNGTWEQSAGTITFSGGGQAIPASGKLMTSGSGSITMNGGSASVSGGTLLMNSSGVLNIGSATGQSLQLSSGTVQLTAGTVNVAARVGGASNFTTGGSLILDGATVNINTVGLSNTTTGAFSIASATTFSMTGGTLNILQANQGLNTTINDLEIQAGTISGGTITLGSGAPGATNFLTKIDIPVNDFVNNTGNNTTTLTGDLTVSGTLTMSGGNIDARLNSKTVYVSNSATGAISYTAGMVDGNLKRALATTGADYLWPVGVSGSYTPATYNFTNLTAGDLNIIATAGEQPNITTSSIDQNKDVNAYWTVTTPNTAASTDYAGSYAYPSGLNDGASVPANYINGKYNGSWSYTTLSGVPTSTGLAFTGASGFSDMVIGDCKSITTSAPGSDQSQCSSTPVFTLAANAPSGAEAGAWTIVSGPSSNMSQFSDATAYNSTFAPDGGAGVYKLKWTLSIGSPAPCVATSFNTLNLTVSYPSTAPTTANASGTTICAAGAVTLTQSGGTLGTGAYYQWATDAGFTNIISDNNTDPSATFTTVITSSTTFYVRINGGTAPCSTSATSAVSVTVTANPDLWTGAAMDNNWFNAANWCGGVPDKNTPVTIPIVVTGYPDITTGTAYSKDLIISIGASMKVESAGVLSLHGSLSNSGTLDMIDGTLILAGSSQTISGGSFASRTIKNLIDSTSASLTSTSNDTLNLTGMLTFGNTNGAVTFTTGGNLTLKSSASATASIGDITNNGATPGNSIFGNAHVERYIPAGRKWRFIAVNTTGGTQTVQNSWMESQAPGANSGPAGYGVWITGAGGTGAGFDANTSAPTMKWWDGSVYTGITDPTAYDLRSHSAYMVFGRGDRSATGGNSVLTSAVMRSYGALVQGTTSATTIPLGSSYAGVGNPYASALDLTKLNYSTSNVINVAVWDPNLGGGYGLGAFQYLQSDGPGSDFTITPGGGSYGSFGTVMNIIESGQGFFMAGTGTSRDINFTEVSKTPKAHDVFFTPNQEQKISGILYIKDANGNPTLLDGLQVKFKDTYNTAADPNDARKLVNGSENISVKRNTELMAIEQRNLPATIDTVQLNMSGMRTANYRWNFTLTNMDAPLRSAFLVDRFLGNLMTPLNLTGSNMYDFTVSGAPSNAANRFLIVFGPQAVVPVTLTGISATRLADKTIAVKWNTENEINIDHYEVERSGNGNNFTAIANATATNNAGGNASYTKIDATPLDRDNYYRIKAISIGSRIQYSAIVKVSPLTVDQSITVYPNPMTDRVMNIRFSNKAAGKYSLQLVSKAGQTVFSDNISISGNNEVKSETLSQRITAGSYDLIIRNDAGEKEVVSVVVE